MFKESYELMLSPRLCINDCMDTYGLAAYCMDRQNIYGSWRQCSAGMCMKESSSLHTTAGRQVRRQILQSLQTVQSAVSWLSTPTARREAPHHRPWVSGNQVQICDAPLFQELLHLCIGLGDLLRITAVVRRQQRLCSFDLLIDTLRHGGRLMQSV